MKTQAVIVNGIAIEVALLVLNAWLWVAHDSAFGPYGIAICVACLVYLSVLLVGHRRRQREFDALMARLGPWLKR